MLFERPVAVNEAVPLFVDVDGTLTRADISLESFVRIDRSSVAAMMAVLLWLVAGRAVAKTLAARRDRIDPAGLPYRQDVMDLIEQAKGRSEEHTSELQSLMRISYAVFCLNK